MLTQEPLSDVYIFNENKKKYTSTSDDGVFDLKFFSAKDTLTLSLIGYENKKITVEAKEGDIVIFPSFLKHRVNKQMTDVPRITCSFNINTIKGSTRRVYSQ